MPVQVTAGYNELKMKGTTCSVQKANNLQALIDKYTAMQGEPLSTDAKKVFDHVGLDAPEIARFLDLVREAASTCLHKMRHNAIVRLKKEVASTTGLLSSMVGVDDNEVKYRAAMKSLSG